MSAPVDAILLRAARLRWKGKLSARRSSIAFAQGDVVLARRRAVAAWRFEAHALRLEREAMPVLMGVTNAA